MRLASRPGVDRMHRTAGQGIRPALRVGLVLLSCIGLGAGIAEAWVDDPVDDRTQISERHFTELRNNINGKRPDGCNGGNPWSWVWTSGPIAQGLPIRADHLNEMRRALEDTYARASFTGVIANLGNILTTDYPADVTTATPIRAAHVNQLRRAVDNATCCGDWACNGTENCNTCPADCGGVCGNGCCEIGETSCTCAADCPPACGDGCCDPGGESCLTCSADCGVCVCGSWTPAGCNIGGCAEPAPRLETRPAAPGCAPTQCVAACDNDGICEPARCETGLNCADCPVCNNDGVCQPGAGETCVSCPADCPPSCNNNGTCDAAGCETCGNCLSDCNVLGVCSCNNDTICDPTENCLTCPADCPPACNNNNACDACEDGCPGDCPPVWSCTGPGACAASPVCPAGKPCYRTQAGCVATATTFCPPTCNDGACDPGETCASCPADCCCNNDTVCNPPNETCATCPGDCGPCGCNNNGACDPGETCAGCPGDCPATCNTNGVCEPNPPNCEPAGCADCQTQFWCTSTSSCAGGTPCPPGKTCYSDNPTCVANAATDCAGCGNAVCDSGETKCVCPADCPADACGDGCCTGSETAVTCAADCPCTYGGWTDDGCFAGGCANPTPLRQVKTAPEPGCPPQSQCVASPVCAGCPDGVCGGTETRCSCPQDCPTDACGDGCCTGSETKCACPADCPGSCCGQRGCEPGETKCSCPGDCPVDACGDGCCTGAETPCACPADCPGACSCNNNGVCQPGAGETTCTCPTDCPGPCCGQRGCELGENSCACPADCSGPCPCNNDGACNAGAGENPCTCPSDCPGPCPCNNNGICNPGETKCTCPADCATDVCGDGCCTGAETPCSCNSDCPGPCACDLDGTCEPGAGETTCNCADCPGTCCGQRGCEPGETKCTCPTDCTADVCGDGCRTGAEACDNGASNGPCLAACSTSCTVNTCLQYFCTSSSSPCSAAAACPPGKTCYTTQAACDAARLTNCPPVITECTGEPDGTLCGFIACNCVSILGCSGNSQTWEYRRSYSGTCQGGSCASAGSFGICEPFTSPPCNSATHCGGLFNPCGSQCGMGLPACPGNAVCSGPPDCLCQCGGAAASCGLTVPAPCCTGYQCTNIIAGTCCAQQGTQCNVFSPSCCAGLTCVGGPFLGTCQPPCVCNDDGDPCTTDACISGSCQHTPINCADTDSCTNDSCVAGACQHSQINCDDTDPCTADICVAGACQHSPINCADTDPCTNDSCVAGACQHPPKCSPPETCSGGACISPCPEDQHWAGSCCKPDACGTNNCACTFWDGCWCPYTCPGGAVIAGTVQCDGSCALDPGNVCPCVPLNCSAVCSGGGWSSGCGGSCSGGTETRPDGCGGSCCCCCSNPPCT